MEFSDVIISIKSRPPLIETASSTVKAWTNTPGQPVRSSSGPTDYQDRCPGNVERERSPARFPSDQHPPGSMIESGRSGSWKKARALRNFLYIDLNISTLRLFGSS